MSTNFFWFDDPVGARTRVRARAIGGFDSRIPGDHLGKRSAAGPYCRSCGVTLCRGGEVHVHDSISAWHNRCPVCFREPSRDDTTCSFSWAQDPFVVAVAFSTRPDEVLVIDEYGVSYTGAQFMAVAADCRIVFTSSIGDEFR